MNKRPTTRTATAILALALVAFALPSMAAEPVNIARLAGVTKKAVKSNGSEGGFTGGTGIGQLFDGNLKNCTRLRDIGENGYIQLDFPEPYFVTSINVTKWYRHKYTLSISADGTAWTPVDYATSVNRYGTKSWGVYKAASHVQMSFPEASTHCEDVAELEVWGVPVSGMTCPHANLSAWAEVVGSATCTTPALETASCSNCGEVFTRESDGAPLGHAYLTNVTKPGYGWFSCSRCDMKVACYHGPIALIPQGGMSFDDRFVQFTDVVALDSLGWDEFYGTSRKYIIDGNTGSAWTGASMNSYIDVSFGAPVALTKVEVFMGSGSYTVRVYKLQGGTESLLKEQSLNGENSPQSAVFEFDHQEVGAIRIRQTNPSYSQMKVNEVRVYGTVPGDTNVPPMFLFMQ